MINATNTEMLRKPPDRHSVRQSDRATRLRRAVKYLLLGAVLSWSSAALGGFFVSESLQQPLIAWSSQSAASWPGPVPDDWNNESIRRSTYVSAQLGFGRADWIVGHGYATNGGSRTYHRTLYGFPVPCVISDLVTRWSDGGIFTPTKNYATTLYGGMRMHNDVEWIDLRLGGPQPQLVVLPNRRDLVLPLLPWWPGFILNTIFWSLIAAWIARLFRFARWGKYLSRGQCPKCKYPIGSTPVCPECGIAVPGGLAHPAGEVP